jgi:DNA-binding FadR family transcriptional regulator
MQALENGDAEAAATAMHDHLCSQERILREEKAANALNIAPG